MTIRPGYTLAQILGNQIKEKRWFLNLAFLFFTFSLKNHQNKDEASNLIAMIYIKMRLRQSKTTGVFLLVVLTPGCQGKEASEPQVRPTVPSPGCTPWCHAALTRAGGGGFTFSSFTQTPPKITKSSICRRGCHFPIHTKALMWASGQPQAKAK